MSNHRIHIAALVCTIDDRISRVHTHLIPQLRDFDTVVISHQYTTPNEPQHTYHDKRVIYAPLSGSGLARNRNNALAHAPDKSVGLLADDDVSYVRDCASSIREAYAQFPHADVITFASHHGDAQTHSGCVTPHTKWSIVHPASFEISFKVGAIRRAGVVFDERFGLGSTYVSGEENIFLKDCLDKGLKLIHVDTPIVYHTHESSGFVWDERQVRSKVAVLWRLHGGLFALLGMGVWLVTKKKVYGPHMSVRRYVCLVLSEWWRILRFGL